MPKRHQTQQVLSNGLVAKWFIRKYGSIGLQGAITSIAEELLAKSAQVQPPVSLKLIAGLQGIVRTIYAARITGFGRLEVTPAGLVVSLERNCNWLRRRESWAHEIAHTCFYDTSTRPPKRLINSGGEDEELICDLLARELLIPRIFVQNVKCGLAAPSIYELRRLCKLFQTTLSTMAYHLICELMAWDAIVLFCQRREHLFPNSKHIQHPGMALRVVYTISPVRPGYFVPLNKRVDHIGVIRSALTERKLIKGSVMFEGFGDLKGEKEVEALPTTSGLTGGSGVVVMIKMGCASNSCEKEAIKDSNKVEFPF